MNLKPTDLERATQLAITYVKRYLRGAQPIDLSIDESLLLARVLLWLRDPALLASASGASHDPHDALPPPTHDQIVAMYNRIPVPIESAYLDYLHEVFERDEHGLREAEQSYGNSWKRRGGVGAFMMLARKWDRLEKRVHAHGWDVFTAIQEDTRREGVIDDVRDLRRYLALVEAEILVQRRSTPTTGALT